MGTSGSLNFDRGSSGGWDRLELKKDKITNDVGKKVFKIGIQNHPFVLVFHVFIH
jgi:hypothetical protein